MWFCIDARDARTGAHVECPGSGTGFGFGGADEPMFSPVYAAAGAGAGTGEKTHATDGFGLRVAVAVRVGGQGQVVGCRYGICRGCANEEIRRDGGALL